MDLREVSGLLRIPGKEILVHSSGTATRGVICEKCQQKYFYALRCDAVATERSVLFLENQAAEERATDAVEAQLAEALQNQVSPVPCPRCGWYQSDMVEVCREQYGNWIMLAGCICFVAFCVSLVGAAATNAGDGPGRFSDGTRLGWLCLLALFLVLTATIFGLRKSLAQRFDPNQKDAETRIRLGQAKGFLADADGEILAAQKQLELQTQIDRETAAASRFDAMFNHGLWILAPLVVSTICFAMVYSYWSEVRMSAATSEWPRTFAIINASGIDTRQKEGKQFEFYYVPTLHYSYIVGERAYHGTRVQIQEPSFNDRFEAEVFLNSLSISDLKASYDPANPQDAVLIPGVSEQLLAKIGLLMIVGVIGLLVTLVLAIFFRKTFIRSKAAPGID